MEKMRDRIFEIASEANPTTSRFIFYVATTRGYVPKTAAGYRTVQRLVAQMRESGDLPFSWIADNTRWMRKPDTYDSLDAFLAEAARTYRRDLWAQSATYVEVWCESDSVAGVLGSITAEADVPLMVLRGYSSSSFAWSAAKQIERDGRPAVLYYFGDWDPSGVDIERDLREKLARYAPGADIELTRVAVTPEDIEELQLPGSIKKSTDSRSRKFQGEAVEVEAIPVGTLRSWCRAVIEQHVDRRHLEVLRVAEESERSLLTAWRAAVAS